VLLALLVLTAAALWWVTATEGGTRWALARAQDLLGDRLQLVEPRGTLLGGLELEALRYEDDGVRVEAATLSLRADLVRAVFGRLYVHRLRIARLDVLLKAGAQKTESGPPQHIGLPIGLRVREARIDELLFTHEASGHRERITDLYARYRGGVRAHTLSRFGMRTAYGALAASGSIGTRAPFPLAFDLHYDRAGAELPFVRADLPLAVRVQLNGTLNRLDASLSADADGMSLRARSTLAPRSEQWLQALDLEARTVDLQRLQETWPHTALALDAKGCASGNGLQGTLDLRNGQPGPVDRQRIPLARLQSAFATDFATLRLGDLRADLGSGGRMSGNAEASSARSAIAVRVEALNLRALHSSLRETALAGPVEAEATATIQTLRVTLEQDDVRLDADVSREGDRVELRKLNARAGGGELDGSGELSLNGPMPFSASLRFRRFDPARFGDYPAGDINGTVEARGDLEEKRRRILAQWRIDNSRLRGQALASRGQARIETNRISQVDAQLRWGRARAQAEGAYGRRDDTLDWSLEAPQLAQLDPRLGGSLSANGALNGEWDKPRLRYSIRAQALRVPGDVTARSIEASGRAGLDADAPLELDLVADALRAGDIALSRLNAKLTGTLAAHTAALGAKAQDLDLSMRLAGGWNDGWTGRIEDLRNRGSYPLALAAPAPLQVRPDAVTLGRLEAALGDGRLLIRNAEWANAKLQTSGEFSRLPAAWFLLAAGLRDQVRTDLLLDAEWQLQSDPQLSGRVDVWRAAGDVTLLGGPAVAMGMERLVLRARFDNDAMRAELELRSAIANAGVRARLDPVDTAAGRRLTADAPLDLNAQVEVASLRPFSALFATTGRIDGRLQADVRGTGTLRAPLLRGRIAGDALAIDVPPYGVYWQRGQLRAELEGDVLQLNELVLYAGDGRFSMSGRTPLRIADGGTALTWHAERFAAMNRPDMRLVLSGDGNVRVEDGKLALAGELRADRGYFELGDDALPELGDDVVIVGEAPRVRKSAGEAELPVQLDLRLALGQNFQLYAYGYQGYLGGRVRLYTDESDHLRAEGRINAERARFLAYGKRLEVEQGRLIFDGPIDNPTLDIAAWQRNQAVEVGVKITGTVQSPQVQLVSEPPVSEGEKLSWLVLGRAPGDAQGADLALLQAAAGTLFGRGDSVGFNQRIAQKLGLDDLSLRGSGQLSGNVVALGKRFSDRIYISFEQGIGLAQSLVKLDYSLSRRWSARVETGTVSGLGLFYRVAFD